MFDLVGKIFGGVTSLAQEGMLISFLKTDPFGFGLAGGIIVVVLIILPIGPAWMRADSIVGKGIALGGITIALISTLILGFDAVEYRLTHYKGPHGNIHETAPKSNSGGGSHPAQGQAPKTDNGA